MTEAEWRELLSQTDSWHEKMKLILDHIDGYGVEYAYNEDDDAADLSDAFAALQPKPFP